MGMGGKVRRGRKGWYRARAGAIQGYKMALKESQKERRKEEERQKVKKQRERSILRRGRLE